MEALLYVRRDAWNYAADVACPLLCFVTKACSLRNISMKSSRAYFLCGSTSSAAVDAAIHTYYCMKTTTRHSRSILEYQTSSASVGVKAVPPGPAQDSEGDPAGLRDGLGRKQARSGPCLAGCGGHARGPLVRRSPLCFLTEGKATIPDRRLSQCNHSWGIVASRSSFFWVLANQRERVLHRSTPKVTLGLK